MTLIFLDDFECRVCRFTYRLGSTISRKAIAVSSYQGYS
jgi:hypothetical protein